MLFGKTLYSKVPLLNINEVSFTLMISLLQYVLIFVNVS